MSAVTITLSWTYVNIKHQRRYRPLQITEGMKEGVVLGTIGASHDVIESY